MSKLQYDDVIQIHVNSAQMECWASNDIHIHCSCLKWNEGAFNNHGYMVFKESWDTGKRRIENENLQRLLPCTPTSGHMTSRYTPTRTFERKLCCIYIWIPLCKSFVRNSPYRTILSSNFRVTSINEFDSTRINDFSVCMSLKGISEVINNLIPLQSGLVGWNIDVGIHMLDGKQWQFLLKKNGKLTGRSQNQISDNSHSSLSV